MWHLNKVTASFTAHLPRAAQNNFDTFQNAIHNLGIHPRDAAQMLGSADYKRLGTSDQYQIRLSGSERATFLVDTATRTVTILQVGGHT
ncbi:hypothetical protein [Pseudomonas sp. Xaverov 259]|uniref:Cytotoxic translational repressor of toxin-antitoxin stability system n=1 Tax=Pseudomonas fluorescens TaxID=294 RepID=A0A1T2YZP9_PSEFL|nr:hypothetical protein [Pseudomonas sp. Xaverov 259]OPA97488.1 hypothetical protein BFW87_07300 [Pseudomonas fluorescens]